MSDDSISRNDRRALGAALLAGITSGMLYLSILLSFAFLIPVRSIFERGDRRMGYWASGAAFFAVSTVQVFRISEIGALGLMNVVIGLAPPAILIAAIIVIDAPFWGALGTTWRLLATTTACTLIAIPGFTYVFADGSFASFLEERIQATIEPVLTQANSVVEGFDTSLLRTTLSAKLIAEESIAIFSSSFAAMLFCLLGASYWVGGLFTRNKSGLSREANSQTHRFIGYHVPNALLWPVLASWSGVLGVTVFDVPSPFPAIAWNIALMLSLPYAGQGLGIASHFLNRTKVPRSLRIAIMAFAFAVLVSPATGLAAAAILPILGLTEVWIPYRNSKGVGA